MRRAFVDTNVIIDVLDARIPFLDASANVLNLAAEDRIQLFTTSMSFSTCIYVLRKYLGYQGAVESVRALRKFIHISPMTESEFDSAFAEDVPDVEDMLQYYSVLASDCDYFITRNVKHFPKTDIPVLTPLDFISHLEQE